MNDNKLNVVVSSFIKEYGFVDHTISSINDAYENGLPAIIVDQFIIDEKFEDHMRGTNEWKLKSRDLEWIKLKIKATKAYIDKPKRLHNGKQVADFPNECRRLGRLYGGILRVDYEINLTAMNKKGELLEKDPVVLNNVILGKIPIVVKSNRCNIEKLNKTELLNIKENPNEDGGHIINGDNSYVIDQVERTNAFSRINTYYETNQHKNYLSRAQIISKQGIAYENTYQFEVVYKNTGELVMNIHHGPFTQKEIPFYIIYRLLNVTSDKDMIKYILSTDNILSKNNEKYFKMIQKALTTPSLLFNKLISIYNPTKLKEMLSSILVHKVSSQIELNASMLTRIDEHLLPHLGTKIEHRYKKFIFMGVMIRRCFAAAGNSKLSTDRDSIAEKYVETPGHLFANNFKTVYNKYFNRFAITKFEDKAKNAKFENIDVNDVFHVIVMNNKLESKLVMTLNTGNADIDDKSRKPMGRYTTQKVYPKSDLAQKNTKRTIRTAGSGALKKKQRSDKVRASHGTYPGYMDPTQTHDTGPNVGIVKAPGIMTLVTHKGDLRIYEMLKKDEEILLLTEETNLSELEKGTVMLNGDIIGYTENICLLRDKYVNIRRKRKIDRFTGIHVNTLFNELDFRVDDGRSIRALLIVYNNKKNPEMFTSKYNKGDNFQQKINFTMEHYKQIVDRKITINDLCSMGIVEWIDVRESTHSVYCANSYETLNNNKDNPLEQYTHCEFQCSLYGVACLTQPLANHNPNSRTAFQAKMGKQTCGTPTFERNPLYKSLWLQYINDVPLTTTIVNNFIIPSGKNIMVAIGCYDGYNQEDALIANERLFDRGCFSNIYSDLLEYPLESNEILGKPDENITESMKAANYDKLKGGKVPIGTTIQAGDVIIGKYLPIKKTKSSNKVYFDKSIIYKGKHPAIVTAIDDPFNEEGIKLIKIQIQYTRRPRTGDKFCFDSSAEILTTQGWIKMDKLTIKHKVAQLNPKNHQLCYEYPSEIHSHNHDGDMYHFESDGIELTVTPNHKMYVSEFSSSTFSLIEAQDINSLVKYKSNCKNKIRENSDYETNIKKFKKGDLDISTLSCYNATMILNNFISGNIIHTNDKKLADNLQHLALHCNSVIKIHNTFNKYELVVDDSGMSRYLPKPVIKYYKGKVYCPDTKYGIIYVRQNGKPCWTGNSSRQGQKGIINKVFPHHMMPYTENGEVADLIFNPHGFPSRRTTSQVLEGLIGILNSHTGVISDATVFTSIDVEPIIKELAKSNYNVDKRDMYDGITGEKMVNQMVFVPLYYQRIQKSIYDSHYAVATANKDIHTHQPRSGQKKKGGVKYGEMEMQAKAGSGGVRAIKEYHTTNSDPMTSYGCMCGCINVIVNEKENIFSCPRCDNPSIVKLDNSFTSNLVLNNISAMDIDPIFEFE